MSLSDSKLRNIKAPYEGKTELADRDGLTVRITRNAIISFNYRFRWRGKQQRIKVGRYPDTNQAMYLYSLEFVCYRHERFLSSQLNYLCYYVIELDSLLETSKF